jgi:hypothetical protein
MDRNEFLRRHFTKTDAIVSRKIGDEFIMVPLRRKAGDVESVYSLNEVAARIWELVDGDRSVEGIKDTLVAEFEVTAEEAENDLVELLMQLTEIGAIR